MSEHLFLGDSTYPHQSLVSELRNFGATIAELRAADRIEQLERELADAQLSRQDEENLRTGQQIQRAAGSLPEMFNIVIDVENGYGGVKLFNDDGDKFDFETDSDGLSYSIENAIDAAISEVKK